MKSNNDKIWNIANDDLVLISVFFEKIKATATSAYSYLDHLTTEPNERTNNVLYMFEVIDDLSKLADNKLSEIIDELSALSRKMEASK